MYYLSRVVNDYIRENEDSTWTINGLSRDSTGILGAIKDIESWCEVIVYEREIDLSGRSSQRPRCNRIFCGIRKRNRVELSQDYHRQIIVKLSMKDRRRICNFFLFFFFFLWRKKKKKKKVILRSSFQLDVPGKSLNEFKIIDLIFTFCVSISRFVNREKVGGINRDRLFSLREKSWDSTRRRM